MRGDRAYLLKGCLQGEALGLAGSNGLPMMTDWCALGTDRPGLAGLLKILVLLMLATNQPDQGACDSRGLPRKLPSDIPVNRESLHGTGPHCEITRLASPLAAIPCADPTIFVAWPSPTGESGVWLDRSSGDGVILPQW